MNSDMWYAIIITLCLLNLFVSIFIAKRDDLERFQKIAQIIIVWLIPVIGAIALWSFNRSNDDDDNKPDKGAFGGGSSGDNISATSAGD